MSRFKLPADQPDFEIEVLVSGADSEGHAGASVTDLTLEVDNSNEDAIVGTLAESTFEQGDTVLKGRVTVHVADPSPDLGVIAYKVKNASGELVGAGSDEFMVGVGAASVLNITSNVPFTPEPESPPPA